MKKLSRTNFIPSEIIEAILLRSPAKSLARFKWVSKEWNSLILHPRFIKTHQLLHQPKPKLLAISKYTRSLYSIQLTIDNIVNRIPATAKEITLGSPLMSWNKIMGSCNGLVLARDVNGDMFLINPTTLDLCKLLVNPFETTYPSPPNDITRKFVYYGFGYDSSTDDYKVVSICLSSRTAISYDTVSIYSLRNNSWRRLPNIPHHVYHRISCAIVNGNCHWLAKDSPSIIAFSFVDELFFKIKLPDSTLNSSFWYTSAVVEIGGRLGVYLCFKGVIENYELWVMQEYGDAKSWSRVFSHKDYMRPMCFLEGSDRVIAFDTVDRVGVLNMDEGRRRNVRIIGGPNKFTIGGSFVETIESPKRIIKTP